MAGESDAEMMQRFVAAAGSQRAAAERLGISKSMVGLITKGKRSGARYREAAEAGSRGESVSAPPPGPRTPSRVRQPVRNPLPDGGSRVITRSPNLAGREVEKSWNAGREVQGFSVQVVAQRAAAYRHKSDMGWTGTLTIEHPTDDQLEMLMSGNADGVVGALLVDKPWLEDAQIVGITFHD